MSPPGSCFTSLESAVLRAICEMHPADGDVLDSLLSTAVLVSRENTGAGFYTDFTLDRGLSAAIGGERLKNSPEARIEGLQHGMGFILWLKDGYANCLEGYSYGESTVDIDFARIKFEILNR